MRSVHQPMIPQPELIRGARPARPAPRPGRSIAGALACLLAIALFGPAPAPAQTAPGAQDVATGEIGAAAFERDLEALTRHGHRLAGTEAGREAARWIRDRFEAVGVDEVMTLPMMSWQTRVRRCELEVGGRTVSLLPARPNAIMPASTPPGGITGRLFYAGDGDPADYGARTAEGAIVVLDYDASENWQQAFALGARAVIFIGGPDVRTEGRLHVAGPADLPRFYAPGPVVDGIDLREPREAVTLHAEVSWERGESTNVVGLIRGTDPATFEGQIDPEAIVLSAHHDTFGEIPRQSPGARGAANVAALIETAGWLVRNRPKRDILVVSFDNHARRYQGARWFYDAASSSLETLESQRRALENERDFSRKMRRALAPDAGPPEGPVGRAALRRLGTITENLQADLRQELISLRLERRDLLEDGRESLTPEEAQRLEEVETGEAALNEVDRSWNVIRRLMHNASQIEIDAPFVTYLENRVPAAVEAEQRGDPLDESEVLELIDRSIRTLAEDLDKRLAELAEELDIDAHRHALREMIGDRFLVLHVGFDFADGQRAWGPVVSDSYQRRLGFTGKNVDSPGSYDQVLDAWREAAGRVPEAARPLAAMMGDSEEARHYIAGPYASSSVVAGYYRIHNVTMLTAHDRRLRDGHPADRLARLESSAIRDQAVAGRQVLRALGDVPSLPRRRVFDTSAESFRRSWEDGRAIGHTLAIRTTGAMSEERPATGAVVAHWPRLGGFASPWEWLSNQAVVPGFDPLALTGSDANGRFGIHGVNRQRYGHYGIVAGAFDARGRPRVITTEDSVQQQWRSRSVRVGMFRGDPYALVSPEAPENPDARVLRGVSTTPFLPNQSLTGTIDQAVFFFIERHSTIDLAKVWSKSGIGLLNVPEEVDDRAEMLGHGYELDYLQQRPETALPSARDRWQLNEHRLALLRGRVGQPDLEALHADSFAEIQAGREASTIEARQAHLARASQLATRIYGPLRSAMNDLVHAVVMLLLLAIPFAFSLERLLVGASGIFGRVAGFVAVFSLTFLALYYMHPGFAIATTPIIILEAFSILLLSSMVIWIITRRFQDEMQKIQGQSTGRHDVAISRAGTLLAAVNMGISTMRRRPIRTTLTAVTVIMLTFTVLSFASLTNRLGVRSVFDGPLGPGVEAGLYIRQLDYGEIPGRLDRVLAGLEGEGGHMAGQWWWNRSAPADPMLGLTAEGAEAGVLVSAVMGMSEAELARWPAMAEALGGEAMDGVYLPRLIADELGVQPGDSLVLGGVATRLAGIFDASKLETLQQLDGREVLPVDFVRGQAAIPGVEQTQSTEDAAQKEFQRLNSAEVVVAPVALVRTLGGDLHGLNIYPQEGMDLERIGEQIARQVEYPVWVQGQEGVNRLVFTRITEVAGAGALFVPVLLGGLIIFGTLLGSISDREREIYTFSALGLAPAHVGFLFFAEAAVYAVVGGLGGQLLAQVVALVATQLAEYGWIEPPAINYSSTNALFAIGVVMLTVLVSAIYPALIAGRSANPGVQRTWRMPAPEGDDLVMTFPFTVSAYDITGVVSFLEEYFRAHDDAGLGAFAASQVAITRDEAGRLTLQAELALAPFDLGVTQTMALTAIPSEIPGVDEVEIRAHRLSGARGDWTRCNRAFVTDLRKQFLLWRTLSSEVIESYRAKTLRRLGESPAPGTQEQT